jgi:Tfp pilus assembly protein PilF
LKDYKIDFNDSQKMWQFSMESCKYAHLYAEARNKFAGALKALKIALATEYAKKTIEKKHSEDKAYLILANDYPECRTYLTTLIEAENEYKGFEKILEARSAALSFNQSLIKNKIAERG